MKMIIILSLVYWATCNKENIVHYKEKNDMNKTAIKTMVLCSYFTF